MRISILCPTSPHPGPIRAVMGDLNTDYALWVGHFLYCIFCALSMRNIYSYLMHLIEPRKVFCELPSVLLVCFFSDSDEMEKTVLVSIGENRRIEALSKAVRVVFSDVLRPNQEFFLQVKHEDWGGLFIDLLGEESIANKSLINAVILQKCVDEVSLVPSCFVFSVFTVQE